MKKKTFWWWLGIIEPPKGLKRRPETLDGLLELKVLRVNFWKTKTMINSENAGKVTEKSQSPSTVCRKSRSSNSILCQFWRCQVRERCSGITGKLEKDSNFKCQSSANQHTGIAEDFPGIELNGQSLKIVEKFCYLCGKIGRRGDEDYIVITTTRMGGIKFTDLGLLLTRFAFKSKKCITLYMCL